MDIPPGGVMGRASGTGREGSALFGIGWGLSGFCPGGLIPALGTGRTEPLVFFVGLLVGLTATRIYRARATRTSTHPSQIEVRQ